jgi:restriction endonuclease S subunit
VRDGWKKRKLGAVCGFIRGPFGGSLKKSFFKSEGYAVYEQQHAINDQFDSVRYFIDESKFREMRRFEVFHGDLIMSCSGTMGKVAIVPENIKRGIINQALLKLTPSNELDVVFFKLWMGSPNFQDQLRARTKGVAIKNVASVKVLKEIEVELPPLSEQKCIVTILDEAFEGIDAAVANTEKNLTNSRELFESYLKAIFANEAGLVAKAPKQPTSRKFPRDTAIHENPFDAEETTKTGGRAATTRHILGNFSLSVGMPKLDAKKAWNWLPLTGLARMESGHTPSRRHPEYWGGDVPWIGIRDAKRFHGVDITETEENTNQLGLANSSARLLPSGTVCLSRTASVGYVCVMGRPMSTSQDFVNWVCGHKLNPHFLKYLFMAQGDEIFKFSSGAVHQTIYFPEAKAFHVCIPDLDEQARLFLSRYTQRRV